MAEHSGKPCDSSIQHARSSLEAFTGRAEGEIPRVMQEHGAKPQATNGGNPSFATRGKNYAKNQRKKLNRKVASTGKTSLSGEASDSKASLRLQIKLEKGFFTDVLKNELLKDLNVLLYQTPPNSFIPTFFGSGLRYGKIWFSPENQESHEWLRQRLLMINEKASVDFKFIFEQYNLHQNSICLRIPWNAIEGLNQNDVLNRLVFQNPNVLANFWRVNKVLQAVNDHRLFFFSICDDSLNLLKKQNYLMNYGFQKVSVRILSNKTDSRAQNGTSSSAMVENSVS